MAHVDADRNLLYGLLALQNNFIDREGLLDAFGRWVHDRAIPLGQILRDRGALKHDEYDLLEALVAKHLEKFGRDPQKSLQHLSSIDSVREGLSRIADADLQCSLAHVSVARRDDDPYRTVTQASLGESTSSGSRFRILRPHAKGGLGQVSVALDQELDRPVALKEIQDHHADEPHSRARFVQEAEITGKLEHPGIIPVYGLGHDVGGRPFYAMRFIHGDSLREAIAAFHGDLGLKKDPAARGSRLRELLRRFTDVCNAVAYAHSRGVLHRDLKPGNIMLGPYGETLVVDWGLAKSVGDVSSGEAVSGEGSSLREGPIQLSGQSGSRAETVAGSPIGTPAYASPEQLTGAIGRLGPATDIYGLGATLYALLTGQAPVESNDLGEVIRRVERGEIPPPRSIDPTIPKPLEAICRKAMAIKPEDRYKSARALAYDVTKWLDDEPVTAYREPVSVRAGRWMRRHRTAMIGAAAAGMVGLVGLAAVAAVQAQARSTLESKNVQLTAAQTATNRALDAETKAKEAATEALVKSEESRKRAEAVLGFLKNDVLAAARPEGQEGGLGVDVTVRKAVDAAEPKIAGAFKDQPIVEAEIRSTLGNTYVYLEAAAQAIQQYERTVELSQTTLGPDDPVTLNSRTNLGVAYQIAGRTADSIKIHEATLKPLEAKLGPDHPDTLNSRSNLASAYVEAGRFDEAIKLHEATLKLFEAKLGPDHPDTVTSRSNLAQAYSSAGRVDEAIKLNEEALKQCETKLGPDHPDTLISRNNLAVDYQKAGRTADAIRLDEGTLRVRESKLGPDHPMTLTTRNNLALAYHHTGRMNEAIKLFETTLMGRETKLGPDHPDTLLTRNNLALAYQSAGRVDESIKLHESTLKQQESKIGPDHPNTLVSRTNLGVAYLAASRPDRAIPLLEQALRGFRAKVGPGHAYTLVTARCLADSYAAAGRYTTAEPLLRAGLEQAREQFGVADLRTAAALAALGLNLIQQRKWTEAEPVLRECLATREKAQPDDWSTFNTRSALGGSLLGQKKFAEAEPLILAGYEGLKAREAKIPAPHRARLREAAERAVRLYEGWNKPDQTAAWKAKLGMPDLPANVFAQP
jgi:tetratricopeptide (TPR) repeat protein/tRNA A-37 threonylcarbamoyl transferase component Bud32